MNGLISKLINDYTEPKISITDTGSVTYFTTGDIGGYNIVPSNKSILTIEPPFDAKKAREVAFDFINNKAEEELFDLCITAVKEASSVGKTFTSTFTPYKWNTDEETFKRLYLRSINNVVERLCKLNFKITYSISQIGAYACFEIEW